MIAGKWNYLTRSYEPYELPDGCILWNQDMDLVVPCAQCGERHKYGTLFTSKEIHNHAGLGYGVCEPCYQKEWERVKQYEGGKNAIDKH